ncbi:hypothetical protein EDC31_10613 [Acidomonas methanolica]|nr:hypothetical protein EDC31_10613 [Acidomonas methanolica]
MSSHLDRIRPRHIRNSVTAAIGGSMLALVLSMSTAAQAAESGYQSLIISYRTTPAGRPALLDALRTRLAPRLDKLHAKDTLSHYRILFSRLADSQTWDALVVLEFRNAAQSAAWRAIDTQTPGGLDAKSLADTTAVESTISDSIGSGGPFSGGSDPVYMAIPYDYFVSPSEYAAYAHAYVEPQTNGWIKAGALNAYQLYMARYPAGRGWMSMLLLAYHGDAGLDERDAVVAATRKSLASNPEWAAQAQGKHHIRTEKAAMIADRIAGD